MKTYNEFIVELNKYEKFLLKQGIKAIKRLNLEPNECIAIEDSRESALSAYNAKIPCIAFPGSFHEEDNYDFCSKKMLKLDTSIFN